MGTVNYIKSVLNNHYTLPVMLAFSTLYIAPQYGITDESLTMLYTIGVLLVTSTFISVIDQPAIEFRFAGDETPVILTRNSVATIADYLEFTVNVKNRFKYISRIFFIHRDDLNDIFLQLYWVPIKSLKSEINPVYNTLSFKNGYPSICAFDLEPNQRYDYSLKISCTPQYQEAKNVEIKVKLILCNSNNLRLKLFLFCIRIKAEIKSKSVVIRN